MVQGHECDAPISVILHNEIKEDVRIPITHGGVTIHERKDGPTAITRRAEVDFPLEAFGKDWTKFVKAYDVRGDVNLVTIKASPFNIAINPDLSTSLVEEVTGLPYPEFKNEVMTGYIGRVGTGGPNQGHFTVFGPYQLLNNIPVTVTFDSETDDPSEIFLWLEREFEQSQPVFDNVTSQILGIEEGGIYSALAEQLRFGRKNFTANRDTLADVIDWLSDKLGLKIWFEPNVEEASLQIVADLQTGATVEVEGEGKGPAAQVATTPVQDWFSDLIPEDQDIPRTEIGRLMEESKEEFRSGEEHITVAAERLPSVAMFDATHEGDIQIIHNNALFEMKPYNAIRVKGGTYYNKNKIDFSEPGSGREYVEALATYPPLVDRAGGVLAMESNSEETSEEMVGREAKARLVANLNEVSGGDMTITFTPYIKPFDLIIAQPGCENHVDIDAPPLVYEVERVMHRVNPNNKGVEGNPVYTTELAVTMHADPSAVEVETTTKDIQPSEGQENEPSQEPWDVDMGII